MKAYRIRQWDECHENHEGRKYQRLSWYAKPNSFEGVAFRMMLREGDRNDLYAGWCLLLDMASKGPRGERGWLVRNGKPLSALQMELLTGFGMGLFERALAFFSQPDIAWLSEEDFPPSASAGPAGESPGTSRRPGETGGYSTVQDSTRTKTPTEKKGAPGEIRSPKPEGRKESAALASRTQWAALSRQVKELAEREEELEATERQVLKEKRALLGVLEQRQARGEF